MATILVPVLIVGGCFINFALGIGFSLVSVFGHDLFTGDGL